ncbi:reverse transcriptase domain-containing protein [Tanacetum coccineum]
MPPKRTTTPMTDDAIKQLIAQGVTDALAEYEANKGRGNDDDSHDSRIGKKTGAYYSLLRNALTWWNSHVKTVSHEAAYGMTWKTLKKMMTDKYYPRGKIKKLEIKLWNLKVKGQEVCWRIPDNIQGSVMASKPKTIQDAIEFANELMDQKRTLTCYECGNQGQYKSDCPKLKNRNHGNQAGGTEACGMVYALGEGETNQYLNNMEDAINA